MKLTNNFTLKELTSSGTAQRKGYTEQFTPPKEVIDNLKELCINVLQPIREALEAPLRVSSGYRCERLNKSIGGAANSQHVKGQAADINFYKKGKEKNGILLDEILSLYYAGNLVFDQLIIEFPDENDIPDWIHISYKASGNRGEILRADKNSLGKTYYTKLN